MSAGISTTVMIAGSTTTVGLQTRFPIGISTNQWMGFLNNGFRKINQMSKGGFIWQVVFNNPITVPAGARIPVNLPADFDPGKSAFLYGNTTPATTVIPYKSIGEFVNEEHFQTLGIGMFSSWTFFPNFTYLTSNFGWYLKLAPEAAFPLVAPVVLPFFYHSVVHAPIAAGAATYFPTPDQFDSLIMDLAEAEARREYSASGWEKLAAAATQGVNELIDTYRTDRYDLAGMTDIMMQAQEQAASKGK